MSETTIHCPHCQTELLIEEQLIGQEVSCPSCGKDFVAESSAAPEELAEQEELTELEDLPETEEAAQTGPEQTAAPKSFKLNLKKLFPLPKKENTEELVSIDEEREEELVSIDEESEENEFSAVEESDDEDNLMEPDPGFITEGKVRKTTKEILESVKKVLKKIWAILCGSFLTILTALHILIKTKMLDKDVLIILGTVILWLAIIGIGYFIIYLLYNKFASFKKRIWKRDLVKQYFDIKGKIGFAMKVLKFIFYLLDSIPFITIFTHIITFALNSAEKRYRKKRVPYYDEVQEMDMEYLQKLNVLPRFGKDKTQLVTKMETHFAPAFDGVDHLMPYAALVEESDGIYRYNLEEVTKIYTFEDQLFLYTGVWDYSLGKMLEERTEAFFFKDITDIATESHYKISTKYVKNGCLSILIPWSGKKIRTVYKESEGFVLTSTSGNHLSITIGFEESIAASGATYTHRNDNERIIHAIRKMIEEKKVSTNG